MLESHGRYLANQHCPETQGHLNFAQCFEDCSRILPLLSSVFENYVPTDGFSTFAMLYHHLSDLLSQRKGGDANDDWSFNCRCRSCHRRSKSSNVTFRHCASFQSFGTHSRNRPRQNYSSISRNGVVYWCFPYFFQHCALDFRYVVLESGNKTLVSCQPNWNEEFGSQAKSDLLHRADFAVYQRLFRAIRL